MSKPIVLADPMPDVFVEALADFDVQPLEGDVSEAAFRNAEAILVYSHPPVDGALMDRVPNLKVISNHGVGVDHISVNDAAARNISVGNTPGCLDAGTADMTFALLMAIARNVVIGDRYARSADFTHYDPAILIGQEVTGSTLGIIGMGRIGTEVARRARGFDMPTLYHNRNRRPEIEELLGVKYASLDELLEQSDFVTLNCPLTAETTNLIGPAQFDRMKTSGILINAARGAVVDQNALYEALTKGRIAAAATDVTEPEPLPRDHKLLSLENLIITPHLGSASNVTRQRMRDLTIVNLVAGLNGQELPHRVMPK